MTDPFLARNLCTHGICDLNCLLSGNQKRHRSCVPALFLGESLQIRNWVHEKGELKVPDFPAARFGPVNDVWHAVMLRSRKPCTSCAWYPAQFLLKRMFNIKNDARKSHFKIMFIILLNNLLDLPIPRALSQETTLFLTTFFCAENGSS